MPKCKAINSTSKPEAEEPNSHKKSSHESPPPSLSSSNVSSTAPVAISLFSPADELSQTQAALKALQDRFAQEKKALLTQNEQLQTQNQQLHSNVEQLDMRLVQQEQDSKATIKGLTFEVNELKTELAIFRCDFIVNLPLKHIESILSSV